MGPDLALAASARDWPDKVHRFLLDHGGGRVRDRVMGSEQALAAEYEVLLIDDVCSFLTPRLVRRLREQSKEIVGVFSPEDGPDAKRRLLECGITDVVESEAPPQDILAVASATLAHRVAPSAPQIRSSKPGFQVSVIGAAVGVGATEVSIAVASRIRSKNQVLLVDLDQTHPSLAQRLDLSLHPNLRTAVDLAHHEPDRLEESIQVVDGLRVLGGLAGSRSESALPRVEVEGLIDDLARAFRVLVLDQGELDSDGRVDSDVVIVVGEASPVGITRLIKVAGPIRRQKGDAVLIVVNRAESGGRRSDEIRIELQRALPGSHVLLLPEDRRVGRAAWDGVGVQRGPFSRGVRRVADLIAEAVGHDS